MPLIKGPDSMSKNISELIHSYRQKGKIGSSTPKSADAAKKQAIAISYRTAGKS